MGNDDFIGRMSDELNAKGVLVFKDVYQMPQYGTPYISPHYTISINHRGSVHAEYDGVDVVFSPLDIAVVYPGHTLRAHESSPDYHASLVVVSESLYEKLAKLNIHSSRFRHEQQPHYRLTQQQYADLLTLIEALHTVINIGQDSQSDIILSQLFILVDTINAFRIKNEGTLVRDDARISPRLYEAIAQHCARHRSVKFYADLFCLSEKRFSSVVKRETGHTPGHWIQRQVTIQAKAMLRSEPQASLLNIADRMGFPDLATFSRYFKRATGLSPSDYRNRQ